jgi:hypothetical protein
MNTAVTLTADEFKVLHNSLYDLNQLAYYHHVPKVEEIVERIRKVALKSAYEQEHRDFETKHDQYAYWQKHYGLRSHWSIYSVSNMTLCHPYKDAEYVVYDEHWGDGGEVVRKIEGRDWNALYRAADAAMQASGDGHHTFIESFSPIEDKPGHLRLNTGS